LELILKSSFLASAKQLDEGLQNVTFMNTNRINQSYFAEDEVDEIWITFPDPQIKRTKHRMTNSEFYNCIKVLKNGVVNLKTDSEFMHGYTLGLLHGKDTKFCMQTITICK
jgi:tRNA (guanine-N7-)-methyltransferase